MNELLAQSVKLRNLLDNTLKTDVTREQLRKAMTFWDEYLSQHQKIVETSKANRTEEAEGLLDKTRDEFDNMNLELAKLIDIAAVQKVKARIFLHIHLEYLRRDICGNDVFTQILAVDFQKIQIGAQTEQFRLRLICGQLTLETERVRLRHC